MKGNFKFGVRFLCCWSVHPMEKGKTYMNSFLFNISLILLGSMAITQFVSDCLSDYVAFTDIDTLFNSLIKNLKFFKYFYRYYVFQYILFAIFVLSLVYLIYKPKDQPDSLNKRFVERKKEKEIAAVPYRTLFLKQPWVRAADIYTVTRYRQKREECKGARL